MRPQRFRCGSAAGSGEGKLAARIFRAFIEAVSSVSAKAEARLHRA